MVFDTRGQKIYHARRMNDSVWASNSNIKCACLSIETEKEILSLIRPDGWMRGLPVAKALKGSTQGTQASMFRRDERI